MTMIRPLFFHVSTMSAMRDIITRTALVFLNLRLLLYHVSKEMQCYVAAYEDLTCIILTYLSVRVEKSRQLQKCFLDKNSAIIVFFYKTQHIDCTNYKN